MVALVIRSSVLSEPLDLEPLASDVRGALALSDELGGRFLRPVVLANAGLLAALEGDDAEAERRFADARAEAGEMWIDVAWSTRVEALAAEHTGDVARLETISERLQPLRDAPVLTLWGPYGAALAALLQGDHERALALAVPATERAEATRFERLRWRTARVAWLAASALGRTEEAAAHLEVARAVLEPFANGIPPSLRPAFLARPDVAEVLRVP
jgi:hypothetical protein